MKVIKLASWSEADELESCITAMIESKPAHENYMACQQYVRKHVKQLAKQRTDLTGTDSITCGQHELQFEWEHVPEQIVQAEEKIKKATIKIKFEVKDAL